MAAQPSAFLQYAASETDADILYGSNFVAADPFFFLEIGKKKVLAVTDFECNRAQKKSNAHEVIGVTSLFAEDDFFKKRKITEMTPARLAAALLRRFKIKKVELPEHFPFGIGKQLENDGFRVSIRQGVSYPKRLIKQADEIKAITQVQRVVEKAMAAAEAMLRNSKVVNNKLVLAGKTLHAEDLRRVIQLTLTEYDCTSTQTIVAPGDQAVDPHSLGKGPIHPGEPVVIDIFPRSNKSHYFADMTRTIAKGPVNHHLEDQYQAVLLAQKRAIAAIKPGVAVNTVHRIAADTFEELGFPTGIMDDRMQGFTHSTGHGLGLEIHEPPKVGKIDPRVRFRKGMVVTVEPGLYYLGLGGVRIEDLVVVTDKGVRNLTRYPKRLSV
jgi:Xaa-Pro aminopeptidase